METISSATKNSKIFSTEWKRDKERDKGKTMVHKEEME